MTADQTTKRANSLVQLRRTMKNHQRVTLNLIEVAENSLRVARHDRAKRLVDDEIALLSAARTLKPLRRKYDRVVRPLRVNVIAHRGLDGLKQLEMIRGIDAERMLALATDLFAVEGRLFAAYIALGARMSRRLATAPG